MGAWYRGPNRLAMRFLITGGAGFIGSGLARRLRARGDEICILDNLVTGFERNVPTGAEIIRGGVG